MNKSFHNMEKLPGKMYWLGYSRTGAVYRITRTGRQHYTAMQKTQYVQGSVGCFHARTLADCSKELESR
jgi:hypothetical protein